MVNLLQLIKTGQRFPYIEKLSFSSDGMLLSNAENCLSIWDVESGKLKRKIESKNFLSISPDYKFVAEGIYGFRGLDKVIDHIKIRELASWEVIQTITNVGSATLINFTADNKYLTVVKGTYIFLYDLKNGSLIKYWESSSHLFDNGGYHSTIRGVKIREVSITGKGSENSLIAAGGDNKVNIWKIPSGELHARFKQHDYVFCKALKFSDDGEYIVSADEGGNYEFKLWRVKDGLCLKTIQTGMSILSIDISSSNKDIVVGGNSSYKSDGKIKVYSFSGELKHEFGHEFNEIQSIAFSRNSNHLAAAGRNGDITIWQL